ncbi:hypothetical protein PGB90_010297 [Kerria lacca]
MDEFCGSKFWDWNVTWNTNSPRFTPCFEETILVWIPCLILFIMLFWDLYLCYNSKEKDIPWGWLNITKLILIFVLVFLTFLDIGYAYMWHPADLIMHGVDYFTGIIKHTAFVIVNILILLHRKRGIRTSSTMFIFWFCLVICSLPHYISEISNAINNKNSVRQYPLISNIVYFPTILALFILECFVDSPPTLSRYPQRKNLPPDTRISFINKLFVFWFDSFAFRFYRKPLELKDLWDLKYTDSLDYLIPLFNEKWNKTLIKTKKISSKRRHILKNISNGYQNTTVPYQLLPESKEVSVTSVLWKCFRSTYISNSIFKLFSDILMFVSPQILSLLINFEENEDEPIWRGYLYMFGLVAVGVVQTTLLNLYAFKMFEMGLKMRSTLMAVIYRKAVKTSNNVKKYFTLGDISNLMSVDAQRFYDLNLYLNIAISAPLTIVVALYFLWRLIGFSAFAGLALMIILIPMNAYIAGKIKALQMKQMAYKDERVKITNEILSGIKALKMYAWESSFEKKILEIREKEIQMLNRIGYLNTAVSFFWSTSPYLVSLFTFAIFTLASEQNILSANITFVSLSLFNIMKLPLSLLPRMLANLIQALVAGKRITKFLNSEELDALAVSHNKIEHYPLIIESGVFTWDEDDEIPSLANINIRIETGSLVAIVGPVGCGKSSLLSAFLGEMIKLEGRVNTKGTIAYVPQRAWLQTATIRDNVLFTQPYKPNLYIKVVEACALVSDFQVLSAGDFTEIGDKGINLSGGQKQRISLARAVYNDSDIYFLDDPLSAVDAHVGKHIFDNVIGPSGLLRKKTRLLVTHSVTFLPEVDYIIVMKNGGIVESGTYNDLISRGGEFAELIITYATEEQKNLDLTETAEIQIPYGRTLSEENTYTPLTDESRFFVQDFSDLHDGEKLAEKEKTEEGRVKFSIYWYYVKAGGLLLWLGTFVFNIIFQAINIAANFWLTTWSTDADNAGGSESISKTIYYVEIYIIHGVGLILSIVLGTLFLYQASAKASNYLHRKLLQKVLNWPSYIYDITPIGRVINRFGFDVDVIDNTLPFSLKQLFSVGGTVLSTLYVISYSNSFFVILLIPILIVYVFVQQIYSSIMRQLKRLEAVSRTPMYTIFGETISGASVIRAYGMQNKFVLESDNRIYTNHICTYPGLHGQRWIGLRLDMLGNFIIFFAALFAVLGRGVVNAGIISLSVTYALQVTGSLNWVIRSLTDIETNIVSVERIKDFETTPEENFKSPNYKRVPLSWPSKGEITFNNFKVRYREGLDLVLRGLNLKIKSGEKIGIVGRTGAGKSSLTLSLFRIVEAAEGSIIIDGVDISKVELKMLRSRITIIPQDPILFSGTIRFNLDPFFEYSDQELWHALELSNLKTFIRSLSDGLNYIVSENGDNLSIGQRQLICLARALLRKTKILILDEATAAIDLETDDLIQRTIRTEFKNYTVLTIAHKLNTIMDSDRIVVLENGLVMEFDTPQNLLSSNNSVFYGMAKDAGLVS